MKYAVERATPGSDPYLDALTSEVGATLIASGMGETPVVDHIAGRGLATFTSGAVCIAPRTASHILAALKEGRIADAQTLLEPFLAFEKVRSKLGGIQVLHHAVSNAVTSMGPLMPFISNVKQQFADEVAVSLAQLVAIEATQTVAV